jgi:hypothetical protein
MGRSNFVPVRSVVFQVVVGRQVVETHNNLKDAEVAAAWLQFRENMQANVIQKVS